MRYSAFRAFESFSYFYFLLVSLGQAFRLSPPPPPQSLSQRMMWNSQMNRTNPMCLSLNPGKTSQRDQTREQQLFRLRTSRHWTGVQVCSSDFKCICIFVRGCCVRVSVPAMWQCDCFSVHECLRVYTIHVRLRKEQNPTPTPRQNQSRKPDHPHPCSCHTHWFIWSGQTEPVKHLCGMFWYFFVYSALNLFYPFLATPIGLQSIKCKLYCQQLLAISFSPRQAATFCQPAFKVHTLKKKRQGCFLFGRGVPSHAISGCVKILEKTKSPCHERLQLQNREQAAVLLNFCWQLWSSCSFLSKNNKKDYKDNYPWVKKDSVRTLNHHELNSLRRRLWQAWGFTILFLAAQIETSDWRKAVFLANAYCMRHAVSFCIMQHHSSSLKLLWLWLNHVENVEICWNNLWIVHDWRMFE